jgi:hypothetical protein
MIAVGSSLRVSTVDLAVTPKPWYISQLPCSHRNQPRVTHKRCIIHAVDDHALVLWGVFRNSPQMGFDDVIAV